MNLMITGGAGFIGSRFAEMLVTKEIPNQFEKELVPYIQAFLLKNRIMKGQVAFVKETGKKYRWTGETWADLSEDVQAKKFYKIKNCSGATTS